MKYSDSHCHLDFAEFDEHRDALIAQCAHANIHRLFLPGVDANSWQRQLTLCQQLSQDNCQLFPALGIHPWYVANSQEDDLTQLKTLLAATANIVAIGEIGLDGMIENMPRQQDFFAQQLTMARQFNLPVMVHHRKSHALIVPQLKAINLVRGGVIHAFSGSYQQAKAYLDLGFKLGIGGTITYERAQKTRNTIKKLPLNALLLETDAPAMPIAGQQGQQNSPLHLTHIFQCLCQLRPESAETIASQLEENINQLFF